MSAADTLIPDVLADRYASRAMRDIWSPRAKVVLERELWIAVMRVQRELGANIPAEAIAAYERAKDQVDLERIRARERVTRHDVKARIEEFCALAGREEIHKGLTSRDVTENVEQLQIFRSLCLLRGKYAGALHRLAARSAETRSLVVAARTHNVPAELTTVGRRLAMHGTEMLVAYRRLDELVAAYPFRGIKGAVGTQADLLALLRSPEKVHELERRVAELLGFPRLLRAVGQVYPRSLDHAVLQCLVDLAAGPSSLAKTLRLMAGLELASEGFAPGQVGSSAMPHKMNARSAERINGFYAVLRGYATMLAAVAGDQWNEGDVSCSVPRRVALPGAMFAMDGLVETLATVLRDLRFYPETIAAERERYLPFLATPAILMEAVRRGAGREAAHAALREHAIAVAEAVRMGVGDGGALVGRLAEDPRIPLGRADLERVLAEARGAVGLAEEQVEAFRREVEDVLAGAPEARRYEPEPIL